jgi:DNA-binding LytR/AlgR family response regulator
MKATALIAEDEPLLAQALRAELGRAWPALQVLDVVGHGRAAVQQALALQPAVLFLDIRMPALSGLDAAAELADAWPPQQALPLVVFVTAYDQYAVQAFEQQAVDYVVKPVRPERLAQTVARLQAQLALREQAPERTDAHMLATLRALLDAQSTPPAPGGAPWPASAPSPATPAPTDAATRVPVRHLMCSMGHGADTMVRPVPVQDVLYLEAADKYVRVLTAEHEYLLRTPLKDLLAQLDPALFWQIHRGTVVNSPHIDHALRDEAGRWHVHLRNRPERLAVGRMYAGRFKPG